MKIVKVVATALLMLALLPTRPLEACSFDAYLVGYVDSNRENTTLFQIINPTSQRLTIVMGFFDLDGNAIGCQKADLLPNGMLEVPVSSEGRPDYKPPVAKANVVKIMSLDPHGGRPAKGIVGFQRHYYPSRFFGAARISESNLAAVPEQVLLDNDRAEYKKILERCSP